MFIHSFNIIGRDYYVAGTTPPTILGRKANSQSLPSRRSSSESPEHPYTLIVEIIKNPQVKNVSLLLCPSLT